MTFDTPEPISATITVVIGDVRISAGDRDTTAVEVQPSDPSNGEDRKAAEQTVVEYANGHLHVKAPKLRSWLPGHTGGSVDVTVELPAGSNVHGGGQLVDFHSDGRLGETRITTGLGRIRVDEAATLSVKSGTGDITVGPGDRRRRGHGRIGRGAPARARRRRRDQELQRRHVGRRGAR